MRAILYARVSTEEQMESWSIPAQIREYEIYCQQKDWQNTYIYIDEGKSARSDAIEKRPQFRQLLGDCEKGTFDVVVVHSLDRWSRNLRVTLESFKNLADRGVAFASITENIDYSTPEGKLFIAMLGAFAQYFSDSLAKHTSKGMKERVMNGFPNGDIPFGYRRHDKNNPNEKEGYIYIVPDEAEAVRKIFQFYAAGDRSCSSLATLLNEQGFRTRNKHELKDGSGQTVTGPRPFSLYSVRWLLHNPFYTGKVKYKGNLYQGTHEAIIDEGLFNSVQARLAAAKGRSKTFSTSYRLYLLKGLARCIYCGYPLWSETLKGRYSYYREQKNARGNYDCPGSGKSIRCSIIDEQVNNIIRSLTLDPTWREKIIEKISAASERESILKQRKQTEEKLRRLWRIYMDGVIDDGEYNVQHKLLQDALDSLVIPEMDATLRAGELLEGLGLIWDRATDEERHRLLSGMIEAVYIDLAASRSIVGIQPKPPFYNLFESLKHIPNNKVIIFRPGIKKETGPGIAQEPDYAMVETGES
jgi:site-specific DNA recombinase